MFMPLCAVENRNMRFPIVLAALLLFAQPAQAASLEGLAVKIANQSEPILCAEKDNVTLALSSDAVKSFRDRKSVV